MIGVKWIVIGTLKENYWRDAAAEYEKRLSSVCRSEWIQLKEERLPEAPSEGEIRRALEKEGERVLNALPQKAYRIALCVEGKQLSSEELAEKLEQIGERYGEVCFVIGSSYGLSDAVKQACHFQWSVSRLTFPHQLMRVLLLETVYRSFQILKGTRYHK